MQSEAAGLSGGIESWKSLSKALNCTDISCVRKAPATSIKTIIETSNLNFEPVKDDITCSKNISYALSSAKAAKIPFMIGNNAQDGSVFAYVFGQTKPGAPGFDAMTKSLTDITFQCPAASIATIASTSAAFPPIYRYYFNATVPQYFPYSEYGAFHSAEIEPIFGTWDQARTEFKRLGESIQGYWTDFAKDPMAPLHDWPRVEGASVKVKVFGVTGDRNVDAREIDQACPAMTRDIALGGL